MFTVVNKETNIPVKVCAIQDDKNGLPNFLICENGEWKYRSANNFKLSIAGDKK